MNQERQQIAKSKRWVIKVGSSLLTDTDRRLNKELIAAWVEQIAALRQRASRVRA